MEADDGTDTSSASSEMAPIFVASISSVGTASALAMAGLYLHRLGYISSEGKSALARFSQQIALPALFFSKMVSCPANHKPQEPSLENESNTRQVCPSIWDQVPLRTAAVLLMWPIVVVSCGMLVGTICLRYLCRTPQWQQKSMIVAVAFANSTGMPTTLLSVLQSHAPVLWSAHADLDPTALLSLFVVLYRTLLWGVGGWFLKVPKTGGHLPTDTITPSSTSDEDEARPLVLEGDSAAAVLAKGHCSEDTRRIQQHRASMERDDDHTSISTGSEDASEAAAPCTDMSTDESTDTCSCRMISENLMPQPPVIGALLGLLFTLWTPLRQLWVGSYDEGLNSAVSHPAPLGWLLAAIDALGKAAIPLNMAVLGINLSKTAMGEGQERDEKPTREGLSCSTISMVVVGKLVLMPIMGLAIVHLIQTQCGIDKLPPPVSLTLLVVFLTPTANSVMLMVDLADGMKAEMARVLAFQYLVAPFLLSVTIGLAVRQSQRY